MMSVEFDGPGVGAVTQGTPLTITKPARLFVVRTPRRAPVSRSQPDQPARGLYDGLTLDKIFDDEVTHLLGDHSVEPGLLRHLFLPA